MTRLHPPAAWRRYLRFWRVDVSAEVNDELDFHLDMRIRDYQARGLSRPDAERAARARFGSVEAVERALRRHDERLIRDQRRRDLISDFTQDVRYALRSLRRAPGFAVVAILTLALGIGANTAVFSVVDAIVVRALPYREPERLAAVSANTLAEFTRIRELSRSFSDMVAYTSRSVGISGDGEAERIDAAAISANLFSTLGVAPALGRGFTPGDNTPGHSASVVLSHGLWTRRFGGDRGVVGRTTMIDGAPFTIVGVAPPTFAFPTQKTQVWLPYVAPASRSGAFWGSGGYRVVGRLRSGVTPTSAQQEVRTLYTRIRHENPVWDPGPDYGAGATVAPLQEHIVGSARAMLLLLFGVVVVVLLIACANVANLLLVRATARQREVGIRIALGGGRGRLIRQLLTESVVLSALGGVAGIALAWWGVHALVAILPADVPRVMDIGIDVRVLVFTTALAAVTGVVFGLLPALRSTGDTLHAGIRHDARAVGAGPHRRLAGALVAAEIAAAAVLVIGACLLVRSMRALQHVDPGFQTTSVITALVSPPRVRYADAPRFQGFLDEVLRRVRELPDVASAAAVDHLPLVAGGRSVVLRVEGQFEDLRHALPTVDHSQVVTPGYFATLRIPLIAGRGLTSADRENAPPVAVVSESFARRFWPNGDAIGKRVGYPWPSDWVTIVGIVRDVKIDSLSGRSEEAFYRPIAQQPRESPVDAASLVVRTTRDVPTLAASLRAIVAQVDAGTPVSNVEFMQTIVDRSAARQQFTMRLLAGFAAVALLLGIVGIYGVISYAVAERTREIGVRMALGASAADARWMVLREGLLLAVAGLVVGIPAAAFATRALAGMLYGIAAIDPLTFTAVPAALACAALLASYVPARRATRIDPATALRSDV